MTTRQLLPNRRETENISFKQGAMNYIVSASRFDNGKLAELFLNTNGKVGSEADISAADGAVAISLALQYGCPAEVLRRAMKRNADGSPMGPLARALDLMAKAKKT